MEDVWTRIERWLKTNAPQAFEGLRGPAADGDIERAEAELGVTLPEDIRASCRIHDGQSELAPSLIGPWSLLSLDFMVRQWKIQHEMFEDGEFEGTEGEPVGPVRGEWWNPRWIPFAYNGAGDLLCVDLLPPPGGTLGQVVTVWHEDPRRERLTQSFRAWLGQFADDLDAGRYHVEGGSLTRQNA